MSKSRLLADLAEDVDFQGVINLNRLNNANLDNITDQKNKSTGFLDIPAGTTAERPVNAKTGDFRLNTDIDTLEFYDSDGNWREVKKHG